MKKNVFILMTCLFIVLSVVGCSMLDRNANKNADKIDKAVAQVAVTKEKTADNNEKKIESIGVYSFGIDYSLNKLKTNYVEVETAKELNSRIISIAGSPKIDDMEKMKQIIDLMNSNLEKEREKGNLLLQAKDKEILYIQTQNEILKKELESKIVNLETAATGVAKKADDYKVTVDSVNSWFGLGGVVYGMKRFVTSCLIGILIFSIIFVVLRILAASNPIAAAAFSIFNMMGAFVVKTVKALTPSATTLSGLEDGLKFNKYKNTLEKIIDNVQLIKEKQKIKDTKYTIDELLEMFSVDLNDDEKGIIETIKKELKWKK